MHEHHPWSGRASLALLIALGVVLIGAATAHAQGWEKIESRAGVTAYRKSVPGLDLPVIKGVGIVQASVYEILAVMHDTAAFPKWMASCREAWLVKEINDYERIIYNRTEMPWPISDRDAVIQSKITVDKDKRSVKIAFFTVKSSLPRAAEVDGVVRMPMLKGFYLFEVIDENKTRVTYQAQADPGGFIPDWLVEAGSADIPLNTIKSLREQAIAMRGKYADFLAKWDPAHGGVGFEGDHPGPN